MKCAIITNFRGLRALVIHHEDPSRRVLVSVLGKLGLAVEAVEPGAAPAPGDRDLVFFDADEGLDGLPLDAGTLPHIALVGVEAPSRLARVVRLECASHILKPVRGAGVFTALLLAVNEHERRGRLERRIELLEQRMAGRRVVIKAVLRLMALCGIDEDAAYESLRLEAMSRRVPIDQVARERLGADERGPGEGRRRSVGRR